jgi:Fe-Mn family superoxide dismutase
LKYKNGKKVLEHKLPNLPYEKDELVPYISAETLEYHYGKHHKTYVDHLNKAIVGTEFENSSLEDIVKKASGRIFNHAAQVWNHSFYWNCLSPKGGGIPTGDAGKAIINTFGSFELFHAKFTETALLLFGSGWAWLVRNSDDSLEIEATTNAGNPLRDGKKPLLVCDIWEHAYYLDYRNLRSKYVEAYWKLVNWKFVDQNLNHK